MRNKIMMSMMFVFCLSLAAPVFAGNTMDEPVKKECTKDKKCDKKDNKQCCKKTAKTCDKDKEAEAK